MSKKKFTETAIGKFLSEKAPKLLSVVDDYFPPAKLLTALIGGDPDMSAEDKAEALRLAQQYEKELYELEVRDRESARFREVELAKTGRTDWMMYLTGFVGLASFAVVIYAVIWIPNMAENDLFIHLMGMIEGVVISNLFAYYFGTSKTNENRKI